MLHLTIESPANFLTSPEIMHLLKALSVLDICELLSCLGVGKFHDKLCDGVRAFQFMRKFTLEVILHVVFNLLLLL